MEDNLQFDAESATRNSAHEAEKYGGFTYRIVMRPTAFFESLWVRLSLLRMGSRMLCLGTGSCALVRRLASRIRLHSWWIVYVPSEDKINRIVPIDAGQAKGLTPLEQVPIGTMYFAIGVLDFLVKIFPSLEDAAEFGKIGRYYLAESMLTLDPDTGEYNAEKTPSYGKDAVEEFFRNST